MRIDRNSLCPCGSFKKYKKCCLSRVDWEKLATRPIGEQTRYLSLRGKNRAFMALLLDALQINEATKLHPSILKEAMTPQAVRRIADAVVTVWPDGGDLARVLRPDDESQSGLYVGVYEESLLVRGVTRHALYADKVLLLDPLLDPRTVKDEYNPYLHPEAYQSATVKFVRIWLRFWPWIEKGLLAFVRSPGDFDPQLDVETLEQTQKTYEAHPELAPDLNEFANYASEPLGLMREAFNLSTPDSAIIALVKKKKPDATPEFIASMLAYIQKKRSQHPYFVSPLDETSKVGQMMYMNSGANYAMARIIATRSNSHIITDIPSRWREMEFDRSSHGADAQQWEPFAQAFGNARLSYLNDVPLEAALEVRGDNRLVEMRAFLRKTWKTAAPDNIVSPSTIADLEAELTDQVRIADDEWKKIDRDLVKWAGGGAAATLASVGPTIMTGHGGWAAGAAAAAATVALVHARMQRASHPKRFPAALFVGMRQEQ